MQRCAAHGIGIQSADGSARPVATLRELRQCHLMAELRRHAMEDRAEDSKIKNAINRQKPVRETESAYTREGQQLSQPDSLLTTSTKSPGISLVSDLRVMCAHSLQPENDFKCLGWNLQVVDSFIRDAHEELRKLNLTWVVFCSDGSLCIKKALLQPIQVHMVTSLKKKTPTRKL